MKFVVSEMAFSPPLSAPVTYDQWMQVTQSLDDCLAARDIQWQYSLVSIDGDRSICVYQVPYAEAAREAYRAAGMPFQQIWQVQVWMQQDITTLPRDVSLIVAATTFDPPKTKANHDFNKPQVISCLQELNIYPLVSLVSLDGRDSLCLFSASTTEDVQSFYSRLGQSFKQVWKATFIQNSLTSYPSRP